MVFSPFFVGHRVKRGDRLSLAAALVMSAAGLVALDLGMALTPVMAQPVAALPGCEAPGTSEYLLLVVLQTEEAQGKLAETLPPSVKAPTCNYLGSRVARMGGFQSPEDADAWASYLRDVASLPAFVAKPTRDGATNATTPIATAAPAIQDPASLSVGVQAQPQITPVAPIEPKVPGVPPLDVLPPPVIPSQPRVGAKIDVPQVGKAPASQVVSQVPAQPALPRSIAPTPAPPRGGSVVPATPVAQLPTPTASKTPPAGTFAITAFEPTLLAEGYAVLVDYGNQTSLVSLLRQLTKKPVGLASYGQRPFLMVDYTPDSKAALETLKTLDKSGFRTMLVDGRRVTLLTPDVQVK